VGYLKTARNSARHEKKVSPSKGVMEKSEEVIKWKVGDEGKEAEEWGYGTREILKRRIRRGRRQQERDPAGGKT